MGMMMPDGQGGDGRGNGPMPGSPDRADPGGRDPLGRYNQGNSADSADVAVPEERERQRTQAIQEELRRRGAEQERPRAGTGLHRPAAEAVLSAFGLTGNATGDASASWPGLPGPPVPGPCRDRLPGQAGP